MTSPGFTAAVAALTLWWAASAVSRATVSAVVVIYQPILTAGEATVIKTAKGFAVVAVPFEYFPYQNHPPYAAVALPNPLLSDVPEANRAGDKNLAALAGIRIDTPYDENLVNLHFENMQPVDAFELDATPDDIAEATIECVRRMAAEGKEHPKLHISGKPGEEVKWSRWEKAFADQSMQKRFVRPKG
jgi:hypothetical protein